MSGAGDSAARTGARHGARHGARLDARLGAPETAVLAVLRDHHARAGGAALETTAQALAQAAGLDRLVTAMALFRLVSLGLVAAGPNGIGGARVVLTPIINQEPEVTASAEEMEVRG